MVRYDLVIYGASGFTGQYVVEYLHKAAVEHGLSWAVAGRDEGRLKAALTRTGEVVGEDLSGIPTIICDSSDSDSLKAMASQAKVVLNCVGPYRFYGEPVVEACVEAGTSHVDISGEPEYLEKMQLKYHEVCNTSMYRSTCNKVLLSRKPQRRGFISLELVGLIPSQVRPLVFFIALRL